MTLNPEVKAPDVAPVEQMNVSQQKTDVNLTQKPEANPSEKIPDNKEASEDPNWKAFREARKRDRAEKEAAERRAAEKEAEIAALKAAMEAAFSKNTPTPQAYQNYYGITNEEETEDQRIEKKVNALLSAKEEQFRREQDERERREYPERLTKDFPDFRYVCSQENLDYLDYHYPELSRPLQRLPDGYDKWSDIYRAVKKFIPNHSTAQKDAIRAEANSNKPKSISSTGLTQSDKARESWQEAEQRRQANWERMQRILKGV